MNVLDQQVGGEQKVLAAAEGAKNGAVVANAQHQLGRGRGAGPPADAPYQVYFAGFRLLRLDHKVRKRLLDLCR
jgi:hypothetical protein